MVFKVTYECPQGALCFQEIIADNLVQAEEFMVFTQGNNFVALIKTALVLLIEVKPCRTLH